MLPSWGLLYNPCHLLQEPEKIHGLVVSNSWGSRKKETLICFSQFFGLEKNISVYTPKKVI